MHRLRRFDEHQFERCGAAKRSLLVIFMGVCTAKYTSQRCPKCGHTKRANRDKNNHRFTCKTCHYQLNDDLVGARNIRDCGIEKRHQIEITEA